MDPTATAARWRVFLDAHTEPNARRVLERLVAVQNSSPLDVSLAPYPKGGFVASFRTICRAERWNDAVVEVIDLGQRVAHAWMLSGSVADDLSGWTTESRVSGVTAVEWILNMNASPARATP